MGSGHPEIIALEIYADGIGVGDPGGGRAGAGAAFIVKGKMIARILLRSIKWREKPQNLPVLRNQDPGLMPPGPGRG